jgi:paraquat-inducible protein A
MIEVYLLGILITIIKMMNSTKIIYQPGVFYFSGLVLISLGVSTVIDRKLFWSSIEKEATTEHCQKEQRQPIKESLALTAAQQGLILCHTCHKLSAIVLEKKACPRCGETLHLRKVASVVRTWALVIISIILFFPANLLPIISVSFLGIPEKSTILDGIIYFFQHDSIVIGLIILTASILVPVFKITGLIILLLATRPTANRFLREKTRMYRFIAFIGRWSMLDIFVIALLTALADYGFFTSIEAAPAATYFCIVVACTMLAAISFDPRYIWDKGRTK